jgi:hypothetical protein
VSEQDPTRLMDAGSGAPEALRSLFAAGAADLPSQAELARLATKLGPVLTPPGAPVSTGGATAAKVGLAALVVGAGALWIASFGSRDKAPAPSTPTEVRVVPPTTPAAPAELAPSTPAPDVRAPESASVEASGNAPPAPKGATPSQPVESEAAFLERARATLASNPSRALALANLHRSRYPSGVLAQEREVIAIEALKRLGRADEAARRSGDFSNRYPGSAYGRKLDASAGK